ncbi:hypothetical protein [uncultured Gammaproteobacteria bacterium]|jgi:hypothetical protein|nr:hypothetical protein [uncultured Gammaproteobacteria bacterium]
MEKIEKVNINDIILDPKNPRIPYSLRSEDDENNEDKLLNYLIRSASLVELIMSIGEKGFFAGEPLLLVNGNTEGKYVVVEGNRRASALKLLQDPSRAQYSIHSIEEAVGQSGHRPLEVSAIIFNDRRDISQYLGYRHITGVKNWKALEKARYMHSLHEELKNDGVDEAKIYINIAKSIGSKRAYVKRILEAFDLYMFIENKDFFNIPRLSDETLHFVNLSDSLNKPNIKKFILKDVESNTPNEEHFKEWAEWLFQKTSENTTRMKGTSSDLKILNQVLDNNYARQMFRNGTVSLKEAELLSENSEKILDEELNICLHKLHNVDRVISRVTDFKLVPNFDNVILDIRQVAKKISDYKQHKQQKLTDNDL